MVNGRQTDKMLGCYGGAHNSYGSGGIILAINFGSQLVTYSEPKEVISTISSGEMKHTKTFMLHRIDCPVGYD
jgi:hypothetical protein